MYLEETVRRNVEFGASPWYDLIHNRVNGVFDKYSGIQSLHDRTIEMLQYLYPILPIRLDG